MNKHATFLGPAQHWKTFVSGFTVSPRHTPSPNLESECTVGKIILWNQHRGVGEPLPFSWDLVFLSSPCVAEKEHFLDLLGKNHNAGPLKDFSQGIHCALKLLHSSVHVASESIWTLLNAKNQLQCKQMRLQLFLPCKNQTHRATIAEYFKLPMTLRLKG